MENVDTADGQFVLVVEDDSSIAQIVQYVLEDEFGVHAAVAEDGERGLELARLLKPALVLLDVNLPRLSGLEVARRLKADPDPAVRAVSLIAMTSMPEAETLAAGCSDHLAKPFDLDDLISLVGSYLGFSLMVKGEPGHAVTLARLLALKAAVVATADRVRSKAHSTRSRAEITCSRAKATLEVSMRLAELAKAR